MVKEIHRVGKIEDSQIYQISKVDFIPFEVILLSFFKNIKKCRVKAKTLLK